MTAIRAIETRYKGYRFRSRLEARWAVFFETLGIQWEYEPEGFDLGAAGRYLPDFKVKTPQGEFCWYDVKPRGVAEDPKVEAFADALGWYEDEEYPGERLHQHPLVGILSGDPLDMDVVANTCPRCGFVAEPNHGYELYSTGAGEHMYFCSPCDDRTPSGGYHDYEPGLFGVRVRPHKGWVISPDPDIRAIWRRLEVAAVAARSARFEHGETPR